MHYLRRRAALSRPRRRDLNDQPLLHALAHGLTPLAQASLDGTTVAANASRHQLVNLAKVGQRLAQLAQAIMADEESPGAVSAGAGAPAPPLACAVGTAADLNRGPTRTGHSPGIAPLVLVVAAPALATAVLTLVVAALARPRWMAATPRGRRGQGRRLHQAQARLAERQTRNQGQRPCKRQVADASVLSPADPEAVVGRDQEGVYRPLYNIQILDDLDAPFILADDVLGQPNAAGTMGPLRQRLRAGLGRPLQRLRADSA